MSVSFEHLAKEMGSQVVRNFGNMLQNQAYKLFCFPMLSNKLTSSDENVRERASLLLGEVRGLFCCLACYE